MATVRTAATRAYWYAMTTLGVTSVAGMALGPVWVVISR